MAEDYEVITIREITDVDPVSEDLVNYLEVHAKTKPHGINFALRIEETEGEAAGVQAKLTARAQQLETIASS
jgi:hypothetical protein